MSTRSDTASGYSQSLERGLAILASFTQGVRWIGVSELGRELGLSRSTISRALNAHSGLRLKTVERVRVALEETGFTPNAHARDFISRNKMVVRM